MQRVWNITDDASKPEIASQVMMVLGAKVRPGRFVKIDDARLKTAHKVHKDVENGLLFIGDKPPYRGRKKLVKLPDGVGRAHGQVSVAPVVEEAKEKVEELVETFDVLMTGDGGDDKIKVLREYREATGGDVKSAADAVNAGGVRSVGTGMTKEAAEELAKKLKDAGADVEVLETKAAEAKVAEAPPAESEEKSKKRGRRR